MKNLLQATQGLLYILLALTLLVWLMYHASGHNIPLKTDSTFGAAAGLNVALLLLIRRYLKHCHNA